MKNMVKNGSSSSEFEVGVGAVLDANSSEGIQGLRDPREQAINASASDLNEYAPYAKAGRISAGSYNDGVHQNSASSTGGRDINRLEYFSMTTFNPRHARDIPDFVNGGSGGGGGAEWDDIYSAITGGRDVNRLEYFSMTTFNPRHAREIPDFDNGGSGGGGGGGGGDISAARGQLREKDTDGIPHFLKNVQQLKNNRPGALEPTSFNMTTFDPGHAREIPDFDNGGSGGGDGDSSAARGQLPEKDTGGMRHWWKKVWRFLRKMAPRH